MKDNKHNIIVIILLFLTFISLYVLSNKTYTSYESLVDDEITLDIATWKILIENQNIVKATEDIKLSDIEFDNTHVAEGKVAPGSTGTINFEIDPTTTQVAIEYNIKIDDHTVDPNILLVVKSISSSKGNLTKEEDGSYSGVFSLDDIKSGENQKVSISVEWPNDETFNDRDSQIGLEEAEPIYLTMELMAKQYTGV